ncbi:hypothetical protein RRSWK_01020 [Rhodopirellula sp. SWK7]|nr:hypothetical protein RRSWK_01020 [Rhodopirellula sp. SWK7]
MGRVIRARPNRLAEELEGQVSLVHLARPIPAKTMSTPHAFGHDFGSYSSDHKGIPHGAYDAVANESFVYLAT